MPKLKSQSAEEPVVVKTFDMRRSDSIEQVSSFFKKWVDRNYTTETWRSWTMRAIAARAGVGSGTVSRLYHGRTKHPWTDKLMAILSDGCLLTVELTVRPRTSKGILRLLA